MQVLSHLWNGFYFVVALKICQDQISQRSALLKRIQANILYLMFSDALLMVFLVILRRNFPWKSTSNMVIYPQLIWHVTVSTSVENCLVIDVFLASRKSTGSSELTKGWGMGMHHQPAWNHGSKCVKIQFPDFSIREEKEERWSTYHKG